MSTDPRPGRIREWVVALVLGTAFGFILIKSEAVSWYRIQEMFRFQSFHMYGILGSAVGVGMISLWIIRRLGLRANGGGEISVAPKQGTGRQTRYWLGGTAFGLGWGLIGACPGPLYALIGSGGLVFIVGLASALAGTWLYAALQPRLPH